MQIVLLALALLLLPLERAFAQAVPPSCPSALGSADLIDHDLNFSYCELCDIGRVRIIVENPLPQQDDVDFGQLVVTENLQTTGLTYVPGTTRFSGNNIAVPSDFDPMVSGTNGRTLTWNFNPGFIMPARTGGPNSTSRLVIEFNVRRHASVGEEGLVSAVRRIDATVALTPSCASPPARFSDSTGTDTLPLREPIPQIVKRGRNVDAAQSSGRYSDPVYAHENDDVIWRIEVRNNGNAPLQDFVFSDSIVPGNFEIHHVCDSEGAATSAANGANPGSCLAVANTTQVLNLNVAQVFGGGANPYIVAPPGGRGRYYLVGRVTDSCTNRVNSVFDVEWGCQIQPPVGGISATSNGTSASDTALLSTLSVESGVNVSVALTGTNTAQPMGSKGTVTITIRNQSGGTIKGKPDGISLRNLLPAEYVIDPTFTPTVAMTPAYGASYPGMIDRVTWTNPEPGTFPALTTTNPLIPLRNTDLQFELTSSTTHPDFADQFNMIRHGDVVRVTFRTLLIDPQYYDKVGDLDVRTEAPNSDPAGTDPTASFPISNQLEIWFDEFCTTTEHHLTIVTNDTARPEDLDVDISGNELVFILTNTGDPLPLTAVLRNNGGHDARDYQTYVTFGEAMTVQTVPSGCSATTNPPALPAWRLPADLPPTASIYLCDRGVMNPGEVERFDFEVVKNTAASFDDDLTFRADVIGEITLSNGDGLWFPAPTPRADTVLDRANNYSLDAVWARVVGYNLNKRQLGVCTENPPAGIPDLEVQIGEECSYFVESGGWFGFRTPGFTYIAVQNVQVVDQIPDGQGYISSTDPFAQSTSAIQGVLLNPLPAPTPLSEAWFDWTFNRAVPAERITEKDHWFRVNVTTRLLNDPVDTSAPPNVHAAISPNIMSSTFDAVFFNESTNMEELYNLGPNTIGFPREVHRRVDLTVTEPRLILTKDVCNETRYGVGPACSNFLPLVDDGDAFDTYVYRVRVENEAASGSVTRAPAYDVTVTSVTDPSDQLFVDPLTSDALDNDADALIDAGDAAGEGLISDNTVLNSNPAQITAAYTHSDGLLRIDAGQTVELFYRVDPDDMVAPLQLLTNTVTATYDSLAGPSGSQTAPMSANGEIGGARQYVSQPAQASIQIIPVEVSPKQILRLSNTPSIAPASPQPVSVGEEVEFQLRALIPVAQLRGFTIRDELPAGLTCSEAPAVDLGAAPYAAAGFMPGGVFTPTCTDTEVVWSFGDQTVTQSPRTDRRFDFAIRFVARVDNIAGNQDGVVIRNGGTSTVTTVRYVNEAAAEVVLPIGEAAVVVQEPLIALTKAFSVAQVDAGDVPRVTVTATNNGSASAYQLRVLDDLSAVGLRYVGDIAGANPPTVDLALLGADRPVFSFAPGFGIAPGETVSFSFTVEVDAAVEPHTILANTVYADWTSLPSRNTALNTTGLIGDDGSATGMRNGALPNAADPLNDYEAQASASVTVAPLQLSKIDVDPALAAEIGAHKPFEVLIELPEGVTRNVIAADDLASGSVSYVLADNASSAITYDFVGITSINGQAPSAAAFTSRPADGTSGTAIWSIGSVVTQAEDDLTASALSPSIRIRYSGRINNDLVTNVGSTLQNSVVLNYTNGQTDAQESLTAATAAITAIESSLTATKLLTNVTPGKPPAAPPAFGDVLQYVVTIVNGGNATAYDLNVVDTLPPEVALFPGFTPAAAIDSAPVSGFVGDPAGAPNGPLVWGRGNGDGTLDLPAGSSLALTYQVVLRTLIDGAVIANRVFVDWTSLATTSSFERTGNGCPIIVAPDDYCYGPAVAAGTTEPLPPAIALLKANTQATAAVGEAFTYRLTIPETPYPYALYDVRILDDLVPPATAADLRFLGVTKITGVGAWTPVNSGSAKNLVIEDLSGGIDIQPSEQIVLEISVVLEDTPTNTSGLTFTNTASYTYNWIDGDVASQRDGPSGTTAPMTIVGPDVVNVVKSGPVQMTVGMPATFTLNAHNAATGRAYNTTLVDQLPNTPAGGTCDVSPAQVSARVFDSIGTTAVSPPLVLGSDFSVNFAGDPTCSFSIAMLSNAASIGADERLIVSYETLLDAGSQDGAMLTNVAGATQWFSADGSNPATVDDRRSYTRVLTNGTVNMLDHEDAHTVILALPLHSFEKTVRNLTTGANPATTASPGDRLRYALRVTNLSDNPLDGFAIRDELDALNAPALFQPGTLAIVPSTLPPGADASLTSATGGANGSGLIDVRNLSLPNRNDSLQIEFEITLVPVIANGSYAANQSQLSIGGIPFSVSDDPNVNGPADPVLAGDEDPTRVLIQSAPSFQIQKISTDLTGDPNILLAGETLRYTITVKNVGSDHAVGVSLRDAIPVNTQYVAGSTNLNGTPLADGVGGIAPLSGGVLINAPGDPTPGVMQADASPAVGNVATLVFDVVVDPGVVDGTVISNQAFVSAPGVGIVDRPSDDPRTAIPDDPTRNVVGSTPLLFAPKSAMLLVDNPPLGVVDPLDVLRYTIGVYNSGAVAATRVTLADVVPANTTYIADSLTLNGLPVGPPGSALSPLVAGIDISSSDLTPPLPGPTAGVINPGANATIEFDLQVNAGTPAGTLITNQALVRSEQIPTLLTDGDGNPATGPEPTVVLVGAGQQLAITKQVAVVGGGAALAGSQLEYVVRVVNIATVPADGVVITDDLDAPLPGQLAYVAGSASMNGVTTGVTVVGSLITADFSSSYGPLQPGQSVLLRFRATLAPTLAMGTVVTNTGVVRWNTTQTASASVSVSIGGMPGVGALSGTIWHDADFDDAAGPSERLLGSWIVDLYRNGAPLQSVVTDSAGAYRMSGLPPNDLNGDLYELRFRAADAGANTAALGRAQSAFTNGLQTISNIIAPPGSNLLALNLPIDPNGVVYESIRRTPLAGVTLTLLNASGSVALPLACLDDPAQQGQITGSDGYYKFDLNFSQAACPSDGNYFIAVAPPGPDYVSGYSQLIPPTSDATTTAFSVPACPGTGADANPATAQYCEAQLSEFAPPTAVPPRTAGTTYHVHLMLAGSPPGSSALFNNHIPIDPVLDGALAITKTTPSVNVSRGQLVPYEITLSNQFGATLGDVSIIDTYPAGFQYVEGSAQIDGVATEPTVNGQQLVWDGVTVDPLNRTSVKLLLAVGAGVTDGDYVNRAQAINNLTGTPVSGQASATVRLVPDPTFDCTDVMGKVYDDRNRNGLQEGDEAGLAGVRLATARGLVTTTDQHGRFHITCAVVPNEDRGSNFVLKLDDRSLPSGYRLTSRPLQVKRATRGKVLRFNYGASIHRVVGLDLADAVFEPGTTEMREQWKPRLALLMQELEKSPSILRLSYVADVEAEDLVDDRIDAVKKQISNAWDDQGTYELTIEQEVFWRRGAPLESR